MKAKAIQSAQRVCGFSLLELIVVMAIMAIMAGILLPAIHRARSRSSEIFCQSNLRTLATGLMQYTMDYNDRYPFGFTFNKFNPNNGRPTDGGASGYITWFSSVDKYLTSGANEIILLDANSGFVDGATTRNFHSAFKCPSVSSNFQQKIQYYQNNVVMPHVPLELNPQFHHDPVLQPAKVNQLYPFNALIWDTPLFSQAAPVTPSMYWLGSPDTAVGATLPATKIDGGQLMSPSEPELRFRGPQSDRFSTSTDAMFNPAGPILWPSDEYLASVNSFIPTYNTDVTGSSFLYYMIGGPRYRHTGNGCNVLFADGSVRTLYLHPWRKVASGPVGTGSADYNDSDFRRFMLMTKWPPGFFDSGQVPTK